MAYVRAGIDYMYIGLSTREGFMNIALKRLLAGFLVITIGIAAGDAFAQKKPPKRSFTKITGDLYRA
jgi:hypothetical protein